VPHSAAAVELGAAIEPAPQEEESRVIALLRVQHSEGGSWAKVVKGAAKTTAKKPITTKAEKIFFMSQLIDRKYKIYSTF